MKIRTAVRPLPLIAALLAPLGCGGDAPAQEPDTPTPVTTAAVEAVGPTVPLRAAGRVGDRAAVPLAFAIGGVVETVAVRNGDRVAAGELLARLDLAEIEARVAAATAALAKAERDLERASRLFADSAVARATLDDAGTAAEVARADLQAARFARDNAEIRAPAAGRVTARRVEPRQVVSAGQTVVELGEAGWRFRAALADRDVLRVRVGTPAIATFGALPGADFEARVVEIAGAADPSTGTFLIELAVTDPGDQLRSGLIGAVELRVTAPERVVALPVDALSRVDGARGEVWLAEEGVARRREVEVVLLEGDRALVRGELAAGASVVTRGAGALSDGAPLSVAGGAR